MSFNNCFYIKNTGFVQVSMQVTAEGYFEFSTNGVEWFASTEQIIIDPNDIYYVKGTKTPSKVSGEQISNWFHLTELESGGEISIGGSLMSLIHDGDGNNFTPLSDYTFGSAFFGSVLTTLKVDDLILSPTLNQDYYRQMFYRCTCLKTVPTNFLPATTIPAGAYRAMFAYCSNLENVPKIPATVFKPESCSYMFQGTKISVVPEGTFANNITTFGDKAFWGIFDTCSSLNEIHVPFTDWHENANFTFGWVTNVPSNGKFYCFKNLPEKYDDSHIPSGWVLYVIGTDFPFFNADNCLSFDVLEDNCIISLNPSAIDNSNYYFSTDGVGWTKDSIQANAGERVFCLGTNYPANQTFSITKPVKVNGSVMSLLDGGAGTTSSITETAAFKALFKNCTNILEISESLLPATTLANFCYEAMFSGCTGITELPRRLLKSTSLKWGCYREMFRGTSITEVPEGFFISSDTEIRNAYQQMFDGCTKLNTVYAPPFTSWGSTDTTLWLNGVAETGNFYGYSSLPQQYGPSRIPSGWRFNPDFDIKTCLNFVVLENDCTITARISQIDRSHYFFSKDNGATWVPDTINANAGDIVYIKGTQYPTDTRDIWAPDPVFTCNKKIEIHGSIMALVDSGAGKETEVTAKIGFGSLFRNLPVVKIGDNVLTATKLAEDCYWDLFMGCKELTEIPYNLLHAAEELAPWCYRAMFNRCDNIKKVPNNFLPATEVPEGAYSGMFVECKGLEEVSPYTFPRNVEFGELALRDTFARCPKLHLIYFYNKEWGNFTLRWVKDVADSGDFYCVNELPEICDENHIPVNWRIHVIDAPKPIIKEAIVFCGKIIR